MVYIPTFQSPSINKPDPCAFTFPCASDSGVLGGGGTPAGSNNATIYAVDVSTGKIAWSYFIPNQSYRGGLTVSGGVVYLATADGFLRLLDAKTGSLISALPEGGPLRQQPAIGADTNGVMKVFLNDGAPGAIVALSVQPGAAQSASTTTSVTTLTATITQGGVTTTTTSVSTATVTVPGAGGGGSTATVTSTVTNTAAGTSGIDPTLFYVVAGVAALLAITTAAFAVRGRRRPA